MKPSKIVIDSNVWISFLISNKPLFLNKLLFENNHQLVLTEQLLEEIRLTALRNKFRKYFDVQQSNDLINQLQSVGEIFTVISNVDVCRDPKDNFLLNLCIDSNANFFITGDKDLLILKKIENTKIVTLKEFEKIINK